MCCSIQSWSIGTCNYYLSLVSCCISWKPWKYYDYLLIVQGRLSMDDKITCPYVLCNVAYAWLSSRFVLSLVINKIIEKTSLYLRCCLNFLNILCSCIYLFFLITSPEEYSVWRSTKEQVCVWTTFSCLKRYVECLFLSHYLCLRLLMYCMYKWRFGRLDLYLPSNNDGLKPVVVFVTGGAWIIGWVAHRSYNILLCIRL